MAVRKGDRKQQAAIEYLLVYGIAFLVILIAAGFLYTLYQSPGSKVPNTCTFSAGVTCSDIIIATNTMTGNTQIIALFNNAGDTYIQAPNAITNLNGVNSSAFTCLPSYVRSGGSILCVMNLTSKSAKGTVLSGTIYLTDQNCAFSTSFGSCQTSVVQTYSGKFEGTSQAYNKKPTLGISLIAATYLPPANNQRDQLTATLTLSGTPLKGATINFTASNPLFKLSPKYPATNSTGQALSFIWGPSFGITTVYANFTNTISANIVLGFSLLGEVPFTFSNSQSLATGSNFQQMVFFNPSQSTAYTTNEASDLGNIRFFGGPTELDSWCESGCTSSSSNAVFWVKLPSGINANANLVVNMTLLSNSVDYDGIYAGEAPQLTCGLTTNAASPYNTILCSSGTYAKYDNGANVFSQYTNFAGTSIPSGWSTSGTLLSTIQFNNGVVIYTPPNANPAYTYLISTSPTTGTVADSYAMNLYWNDNGNGAFGNGKLNFDLAGFSSTSTPVSTPPNNNDWDFMTYVGMSVYSGASISPNENLATFDNSQTHFLSVASPFGVYGSLLLPFNSVTTSTTNNINGYVNYVSELPSSTPYSGSLYLMTGIGSWGSGAASPTAGSYELFWLRSRVGPPNGVMPTQSAGSIVS